MLLYVSNVLYQDLLFIRDLRASIFLSTRKKVFQFESILLKSKRLSRPWQLINLKLNSIHFTWSKKWTSRRVILVTARTTCVWQYFIDTITDNRKLKALQDMPDIVNFNGC